MISLLFAFLLFGQTATPVTPQLVTTVNDPNDPGQVDLVFHDEDQTTWATEQLEGCDWLVAGMTVIWRPAASGNFAQLTQPGQDDDVCWVELPLE